MWLNASVKCSTNTGPVVSLHSACTSRQTDYVLMYKVFSFRHQVKTPTCLLDTCNCWDRVERLCSQNTFQVHLTHRISLVAP